VNTDIEVPTNPVNKNIGNIENAGTDKLYEERISVKINDSVLSTNI